MNDRYQSLDNTSPVTDPINMPKTSTPRSAFNMNKTHVTQARIGTIIPVDWMNTLPNEDYNFNYSALIKTRNPLVRSLFNQCDVYFHTYYQRNVNLWDGWRKFYTKGRSGTVTGTIPKFFPDLIDTTNNVTYTSFTPLSLSDYLGCPPVWKPKDNLKLDGAMCKCDNSVSDYLLPEDAQGSVRFGKNHGYGVSALPFVMYQQIYRDYFLNRNLLNDNTAFNPDDEEDFILPKNWSMPTGYQDKGLYANYLSKNNPININVSQGTAINTYCNPNGGAFVPNTGSACYLGAIHYRQFYGDRINSSSPFADLVRGQLPSLTLDFSSHLDFTKCFKPLNANSGHDIDYVGLNNDSVVTSKQVSARLGYDNDTRSIVVGSVSGTQTDDLDVAFGLVDALSKAEINDISTKHVNLTTLNALEAYTAILYKNAMTDGTYDEIVQSQMGYNPNSDSHKVQYVCSGKQELTFSDSIGTDSSNLGERVANGYGLISTGYNHFHSPDYGIMMTVLEIVPRVMYTGGLDRNLTDVDLDRLYTSYMLNNLAPDVILNKELTFGKDETTDNSPFSWVERNSHLKSRTDSVSGLSRLSHSFADFDASLVMARRFGNVVNFNNKFVTMCPDNMDNSVFKVADGIPFDCQIVCNVDKVSPMPYSSNPFTKSL